MDVIELPKGIRQHASGEYFYPRADDEIEAFMDAHFIRRYPWDRQWVRNLTDGEIWIEDVSQKWEKAIVFGKGPSFQNWIEETGGRAAELSVCLNETVMLVKDPDFFFFVDNHVFDRAFDNLPDCCSPVSQIMERPLPWEHPSPRIFWNWARRDGSDAGTSKPIQGYATAASCLSVLAGWGVREILMVGFDSYGNDEWDKESRESYPPLLIEQGVSQRPHGDYWRINGDIDAVASRFGLKLEFYHLRD